MGVGPARDLNGSSVGKRAIMVPETGASGPTTEWLSQKIVQGTMTAVVFADREGTIRLWNAGAESMFGFSAEEAIGQNLDLIIPEKHRKAHWTGYQRAMETGQTRFAKDTLKVPAVRKDGSRMSLEFTITMVRDDGGKLLGVAALLSDVTERWNKEKALRSKVAELESQVAKTVAASSS